MMSQKKCQARPTYGEATRIFALAWALSSMHSASLAAQPVISWTAPAECPTQRDVVARAQRLMETNVETNAAAQIEVDRSAQGYRARIEITMPHGAGTRVLDDSRCDLLADEAVLIFALSAGAPRREAADEPRFMLAALGGAMLGPLPAPAPGAAGSLALEWKSLRLELYGSYQLPQVEPFGDGVLAGSFRLLGGGFRGGLLLRFGWLELAPSLGVAIYRFSATGRGGESSSSGASTSWGPALGLWTRVRLSDHWAIGVLTEGVAVLLRPRFLFPDAGTLHRPSAFALQVWAGLELRP